MVQSSRSIFWCC